MLDRQKALVIALLALFCCLASAQKSTAKVGNWEVHQQDASLVINEINTTVYTTENWEFYQQETSFVAQSTKTRQQYQIYGDGKVLIVPSSASLNATNNPPVAQIVGSWKVYERDGALVAKKIHKGIASLGAWQAHEQDKALVVRNTTTNATYSILHNGGVFLVPSKPSAQLVHEWKFDERDGQKALDSIGNANGYLSAAERIPGLIGSGAIAITGRDDSNVSFGEAVGQFAADDFSVSFWLKTQETLSSFDVLGNRSEGSHGHFFQIRMTGEENEDPGRIIVELDNNGVDYAALDSKGGFGDGQWHHIVVTRKMNTVKLFIDGGEEIVATSENPTHIATGDPFKIGRSYAGGYVPQFSFDDLRIYKGALSEKDVVFLYKSVPK